MLFANHREALRTAAGPIEPLERGRGRRWPTWDLPLPSVSERFDKRPTLATIINLRTSPTAIRPPPLPALRFSTLIGLVWDPVRGLRMRRYARFAAQCRLLLVIYRDYTYFVQGLLAANEFFSRLCYNVSVRLSVRLSVTQVQWRIIANLGFKFRSHFTAHCGAAVLLAVLLAGGSTRAMLASARLSCNNAVRVYNAFGSFLVF